MLLEVGSFDLWEGSNATQWGCDLSFSPGGAKIDVAVDVAKIGVISLKVELLTYACHFPPEICQSVSIFNINQ